MDKCAHPSVDTQTTLPSCEFEEFPIIDKCGSRADVLYGLLKFIEPRREVAVKAFRYGLKSVSTLAVENEIRIWRLLGFHPHIASFLAIAPVNVYDEKYLAKGVVSEYCAQGNAWVYLNKSDPDVINHSLRFQLVPILKDVIRGLTHIHAQSIVHGDLKAFNVLIDGNNNTQAARICDFGSSSINCACYSGPQEQEGTLPWDSPELWVPDEDDDDDDRVPSRTEQSDVWAFGCVALEIQMGLTPWDPLDMRNAEAMKRRQFNAGTGPPAMFSDPNLGLEAHQIKRQVWNLMMMCWSASPQQRPTAARLLKEMLGMNLIAT